MLTCREVTERATALLEGELGFRERMAMRVHLAMCVHCRRFNRQFRALVRALRLRHQREAASDDFIERVLNAISNAAHHQPRPEQGEH